MQQTRFRENQCYQACCSKKQLHQLNARKFNASIFRSDFGPAPKQLLQLRSDIPSLFEPIPTRRNDNIVSFDSYRRPVRPMRSSTYKIAPASQSSASYAKITPVMRTPSSGISSSSSSENVMNGLSMEDMRKFQEDLEDPAVEVDLDMFMGRPHDFYKQLPLYTSHVGAEVKKRSKENSYSYVKQQPDFVDALYSSTSSMTTGIGSCSTAASEKSHPNAKPATTTTNPRCGFCWESYVLLTQSVTGSAPTGKVSGPWDWHDLMDAQSNIKCPRFWFFEMERAGNIVKDVANQKPANSLEKPRGTVIY